MREFLASIADHYIAFWAEVLPFLIAAFLVGATLLGLLWAVFVVLRYLISV